MSRSLKSPEPAKAYRQRSSRTADSEACWGLLGLKGLLHGFEFRVYGVQKPGSRVQGLRISGSGFGRGSFSKRFFKGSFGVHVSL